MPNMDPMGEYWHCVSNVLFEEQRNAQWCFGADVDIWP